MLIPGEWALDPDGVERPTLRDEVLTAGGGWEPVAFLVDTGADTTVLHASLLDLLGFEPLDTPVNMSGIGGTTGTVRVPTRLRLFPSTGNPVPVNGPFKVFLDPAGSDCCVLGRDVLNLFSLVVDHRTKTLCLMHGRHRYAIQES